MYYAGKYWIIDSGQDEKISNLQNKLHHRNMQIKELKGEVEKSREKQGKLKNLCIVVLNDLEHFDLAQVVRYTDDLKRAIHS